MSDPVMEGTLYEIASMRLLSGLSLDGTITDHTIIINYRHLLVRHGLARKIFEVDARTGLTHSFTTTATSLHDLNQAKHLIHREEVFIFADSGYCGV